MNSHNPMNRPPFKIDWNIPLVDWEIPFKYYRGWDVQFSIKREKFDSPTLCLFNFNCVADLEKAIDRAIEYREKGI
jgi:hypothetical protein